MIAVFVSLSFIHEGYSTERFGRSLSVSPDMVSLIYMKGVSPKVKMATRQEVVFDFIIDHCPS